jgi:uncharacterized membrane protein
MTHTSAEPPPSAVTTAHVVYALHTAAIVVGIAGTATVVGSFLGSVPSIAAVILSYVKRGSARGSWAGSHYRWQIRTFWFALAWFLLAAALIFTVVGALVGIPLLIAIALWVIYRILRGWLRLIDREPMYA